MVVDWALRVSFNFLGFSLWLVQSFPTPKGSPTGERPNLRNENVWQGNHDAIDPDSVWAMAPLFGCMQNYNIFHSDFERYLFLSI